MRLRLIPAALAVVCVLAGCASTAESAAASHATPAPTQSPLTGPFGAALILPVVQSSPVGKGVAWSVGSYQPADSSVTVDWYDTPSEECGRANEVRLDETSTSVIIQLVRGKRTVPVCSADERGFTMRVPLSAPIGSRSILEQ